MHVFFRFYDQYSIEVTQLTGSGAPWTETVHHVNLKFCVDSEYLESAIALVFIETNDYDALNDKVLPVHLDEKPKESQETVAPDSCNDIAEKELKMDMKDKNAPIVDLDSLRVLSCSTPP